MRFFFASIVVALALAACGKTESDATANDGDGGGATNNGKDHPLGPVPADENGCCPVDPQSGCMSLGGWSETGQCSRACDFWCSTNWRVETDDHGCGVWRYDHVTPREDQTAQCHPKPDAGVDAEPDASSDAAPE